MVDSSRGTCHVSVLTTIDTVGANLIFQRSDIISGQCQTAVTVGSCKVKQLSTSNSIGPTGPTGANTPHLTAGHAIRGRPVRQPPELPILVGKHAPAFEGLEVESGRDWLFTNHECMFR